MTLIVRPDPAQEPPNWTDTHKSETPGLAALNHPLCAPSDDQAAARGDLYPVAYLWAGPLSDRSTAHSR